MQSWEREAAGSGGLSTIFRLNDICTLTKAEYQPLNDTLLTLRARTAWAHDWNDSRSAMAKFQSLTGATFVVNGAQPSANAALLSAGADVAWGNGWTVAETFDGEFSHTTRGYACKGSLRYAG